MFTFHHRVGFGLLAAMALLLLWGSIRAQAQSSSLYMEEQSVTRHNVVMPNGVVNRLSPALAKSSFVAVNLPEPRPFSLHDLVTIVVRESTDAGSDAQLDTKKEVDHSGQITDFPGIIGVQDLLNFLKIDSANYSTDQVKLGVKYENEFKGDGSYNRRDTFSSRITARIIDVKPNGTLVLEARKFIKSDKESLNMILTGTCRAQDVTPENTILSTQLYDLNLVKEHTGELRKATKKGILSKFLDNLFAF